MRRRGALPAVWLLAGMTAAAAGVWDTKPFASWSDKEAEKVMSDSPWAGKATITHAREGANLGPVPDWKIVVSVRSALPIKQALVRSEMGAGGTPTPQHESVLAAVEPVYLIAISGIPRQFGPALEDIANGALLRRKGKDPLRPVQGGALMIGKDGKPVSRLSPPAVSGVQIVSVAQRGGGGGGRFGGAQADTSGITATLVLGFAKDDAITAQDQEFEITATIGAYNVKKTFKLKEMVFMGALAL
jgi:hypothetical protein